MSDDSRAHCPRCNADLIEEHVNEDGSCVTGRREIGVELPHLYDGILFWCCPDCGETWNDWPLDHPRRAVAVREQLVWEWEASRA